MTNDLKNNTERYTSTDRPSWDDVWVQTTKEIAKRSRCSRAQVGAVFVDENKNVLAMSYNGPPSSMSVEGDCINWCPRAQGVGGTTNDYSNCPSNHAEINGLLRMEKTESNFTAYVNRLCCMTCVKALAGAGVSRVVCLITDIDNHLDTASTREYLETCGIVFELVEGV
jgi:dCMP deaminase